MFTPRPTVIDTDPGLDDAVGILFVLEHADWFDLRGLTTVAGNIGLATTTRNALGLAAVMGRPDVPVIAGAGVPLTRGARDAADIHGADGLGGVVLPTSPVGAKPGDAVTFLAELLMAAPAGTVDIHALGPLTNIARLIQEHPAAARRIGRLIAMGGAIHERGNVGPRSEFNFAADPEAAAIVFAAGLPMTLIPLDVTRKVRAAKPDLDRLRTLGTVRAKLTADLIDAYFGARITPGTDVASRPLHDPCVMAYALRPDLFTVERMGVTVDVTGGEDAGALTPETNAPPIDVALGVDAAAVLDLLWS
jgi:purine nucleosidase/pyrimidine-specific ribonucleoside hydrolase